MKEIWEPVSGAFLKSTPLLPTLNWSMDLWPLFTTVIGALAGAWLGAWAAQRIARAEKTRDELTKEIRALNSAIILSYNIATTAMSLKKQHLLSLLNCYDNDLRKFKELKKTPPPWVLEIEPKLMNLGTFTTPIATLQQIILDRLSSNSSATNTISALANAINKLDDCIKLHNIQIEKFQRSDHPPGYSFETLYLGIPVNGNTNNMYGDTLRALYNYNDETIFFSLKLSDDLREIGLKLLPLYRKLTKRLDIDIPDIDLSESILQGLVPQHETYDSWLSGFKLRPTTAPKKKRWPTSLL